MLTFKQYLVEKYDALSGGQHGHYGHAPDNVFYGAKAAGAAGALFKSMQDGHKQKSDIDAQKKTDGSVSVVTVRNQKDSPFHNPKYPEHAIGVAYKGRMDAKTVANGDKVSFSSEDVAKHYGAGHHLTPTLSKLLDHAHKIHGNVPIIQHDIHTVNPDKDLHKVGDSIQWQPNTIRNTTSDPTEKAKLAKAKIVIAQHTGFDKEFTHARGLKSGSDVKEHSDVYNVNLNVKKAHHTAIDADNEKLGQHLKDSTTRGHLDTVAKAPYHDMLERFTNNRINAGAYGEAHHKPMEHVEFKKFVSDAHDKEIAKVKTDKAKAAKTATKNEHLSAIDKDKDAIQSTFRVHHTFTNAVRNYVNQTHGADSSSIKHELPDGKGGFTPATPEGYVARSSTHPKANSQKFNDRQAFNRFNKINGEQRFGKKPVSESTKSDTAIIVPAARMHPPTLAHHALISDVVDRAKAVGGTAHVYLSQNKPGDEKNPLPAEHRVEMLNHAYRQHISAGHLQFHVGSGMHANLADFHSKNPHIKNAHIVLGDDRMDAGDSLKKYNGSADKAGNVPYKFDKLEVHQRKVTPSKYDNIHATELRNKARSGDSDAHEYFKERMHPNIPDHLVKKTIDYIRSTKAAVKPVKTTKKKTVNESTLYLVIDKLKLYGKLN